MVRLALTIRPTTAYSAPGKTRKITVDTSQRVEDIVSELKLEKKGTHFYFDGKELPLNSSLASHNIQDGDTIESCACPELSAVLTAVMKDFNAVEKLPEDDRTEANVRPLLDGAVLDPWPDRWANKSIKDRVICLATMKKVIQRMDRYEDLNVKPCHNLDGLVALMEPVWQQEGRNHRNRNSYIVSANNREGRPTTCWVLLQNKLDKLAAIRARVGPNQDALEEFVKADSARHQKPGAPAGTPRRPTTPGSTPSKRLRRRLAIDPSPSRNGNNKVCGTCQSTADSICLEEQCPFYKLVCCLHCFKGNHPALQRNHERVALTDQRAKRATREQNRLPYVPEYSSGPFSILATLVEVSEEGNEVREYSLSESRLKKLAQQRCRSNLYDRQARGRNAFACIENLVAKDLVRKEMIPGSDEPKFSLLRPGEDVGRCCLAYERCLENLMETTSMKTERANALTATASSIKIIIDSREDATYTDRLLERCVHASIETDQRELPAGDYLFSTKNAFDQETILPLIIERKSWSDLADSVTGRGRRRLDCVRLDGARQCSGGCQLCRMKRSGCSKMMFIIEGARCLNRDGEEKCNSAGRCKYCQELVERHGPGMTHDRLEIVLRNLQVNHDCIIHFTRGFNETIKSLFMIRDILAQDGNGVSTLTYAQFCTNARSSNAQPSISIPARGSVVTLEADDYVRKVQQGNIITTLQSVALNQTSVGVVPKDVVEISDDPLPHRRSEAISQGSGNEEVVLLDSDDSDSSSDAAPESQDSVILLHVVSGNSGSKKRARSSKPKKNLQSPVIELDDEDDEIEVTPLAGKRPRRSQDVDDDEVIVVHQVPSSSSRAASMRAGSATNGARSSTVPLILLTGLYEYDKEFFDDVNKVWKATYHAFPQGGTQTFDDFAADRLRASGLFHADVCPLVPRDFVLFWCLFAQINVHARLLVTRTTAEMRSIRSEWNKQPNHNQAGAVFAPAATIRPDARRNLNFASVLPCLICSTAIEDNQGMTTPCDHTFHRECLSVWVQGSGTRNCPHCNFEGIGIPKDHRSVGSSAAGQAHRGENTVARSTPSAHLGRPPKPTPSASRIPISVQSSSTAAAVREARLRKFGGGGNNSSANTASCATTNTPSSGAWTCRVCTLENGVASLTCEVCEEPRSISYQATTAPVARQAAAWNCNMCTFQNDVGVEKCEACGKRRSTFQVASVENLLYDEGPQFALDAEIGTRAALTNQQANAAASTPAGSKKTTCGACQREGHNRATATPQNCPLYNHPEEVERRARKRAEAERKAQEKREEAARFAQETQNSLAASAIREEEMRRLLQHAERQAEQLRELAKGEKKRKEQAAKRAEARARKLAG